MTIADLIRERIVRLSDMREQVRVWNRIDAMSWSLYRAGLAEESELLAEYAKQQKWQEAWLLAGSLKEDLTLPMDAWLAAVRVENDLSKIVAKLRS